jgi:hypothetical protein
VGIVSRSGGSGVGRVTAAQLSRAVQVGGDITTANSPATFVELAAAAGGPGTGGLDLTIAATTADVLLVSGNLPMNNSTAVNVIYDIATWVTGAAVNWLGQSAGGANNGLATHLSASPAGIAFVAQYVVQAGDLSGANVVLRLHYRAGGARVVSRSVANGPLILSVANFSH